LNLANKLIKLQFFYSVIFLVPRLAAFGFLRDILYIFLFDFLGFYLDFGVL